MNHPGSRACLSGDTILTPSILRFPKTHQPGVCVVPAGGTRFNLGHEIIMGTEDVIAFACAATSRAVANHLEALSHCPVTRAEPSLPQLEQAVPIM